MRVPIKNFVETCTFASSFALLDAQIRPRETESSYTVELLLETLIGQQLILKKIARQPASIRTSVENHRKGGTLVESANLLAIGKNKLTLTHRLSRLETRGSEMVGGRR